MKTNEINYSTLSLRGLRAMLPSTKGIETLSETWFRENSGEMLSSECCGEGTITIYSNGFYTYSEDDGEHLSILRVDGFKRLRYDFADNTQSIVEENEYLDSSFLVALYINGKTQWDKNALKRNSYRHGYYLENDSSDWGEEAMVPSAEEEYLSREDQKEEDEMLRDAFTRLTNRQRQIVRLYFDKKLSQEAIAQYLGVRQQSVLDVLSAAMKKLKKLYGVDACNLPLFFGDY